MRSSARQGTLVLALLSAAALLLGGCARAPRQTMAAAEPIEAPSPSPYSLVDLWALATPESESRTIASLADYLAQPEFDEEEKARAIFRWVAANVHYDLAAFTSGAFENLPPEEILRRRAAVCDGYAGLFGALARSAGLDAVTVRGYAKGTGYRAGEPFHGTPNHAWNAVLVSGRWLLLDCTWAAGVLDERGEYDATFDPYFFDIPPAELIMTHFPAEARWQLLAPPMTLEEFVGLPYLKTTFFKCGLSLAEQKTWEVKADGPLVSVALVAPPGTGLLASLLRGEKEMREGRVAILRDGRRAVIWALAPEPGEYTLRIFATRGDPAGVHHWAADFAVIAAAGDAAGTVDEALEKAGIRVPGATGGKR